MVASSSNTSSNIEYIKMNAISRIGKYQITGIVETKVCINESMVEVGIVVKEIDGEF